MHHTGEDLLPDIPNSYTMGCPRVGRLERGDNTRDYLVRSITILYHLHQCRPYTLRDISC